MQINRQDDPAANTINGQVGTTDAIKPRIEAGSNAPPIDRARMYEVERSTQTEITMRANELEGMFEEELKRVWERFYRVQRTSQSGLGLGLHICNMIIRWHGGQIGAQSSPGKGSSFWFTLPLVK